MRGLRTTLIAVVAAACLSATHTQSQILSLEQRGVPGPALRASLGDTLQIDIHSDMQGFAGSGFALYVRIPRDAFEIIDVVDADGVVQPFAPGTLFADALQLSNSLVPEPLSGVGEGLLIRYAAVLGPGGSRSETGSGVLATFRLRCAGVIRDGEISLHSDPVHETLLVSPDGRGERHFYLDRAIDVTVSPETPANLAPTVIQPRSWGSLKTPQASRDGWH